MSNALRTVGQLANLCGGTVLGGPAAAESPVTGISINAQASGPSDMFAAVPGTRAHGATYAVDSSAGVVLTDPVGADILAEHQWGRPVIVVPDVRAVLGFVASEIYDNPSEKLTIIGMTGTSGKTTTSYLIEAALIAAGRSVGLIGTTGTRINGEPIPTSLTTPEAPMLQQLFATMVDKGVTHVVMEVSSHAISLGRVAGTRFAVQGFANLSQDHLDFHHSMEEYFEAKAQWFLPLVAGDAHAEHTKSVVVLADQWAARLAQRLGERSDTVDIAVGVDDPAVQTAAQLSRFRVSDVQQIPGGGHCFDFHDRSSDVTARVELPLPGRFNVANAALALACLMEVGEDLLTAAHALSRVAVPGRMERVDVGQGFIAVVDYAHKPAAVAAILATLRHQVGGRVGIVLGAGGDRDQGKRPLMGAEAVRGADLVIVTDDNPRSEDPAVIRAAVIDGATAAIAEAGHPVDLRNIADRAQAIDAAVAWAEPGDAIVVAGKGHETGQLIAGITHPFDDRVELRRALKAHADLPRH